MTNKTERWAAALQIGPVFNVNESRMSDTGDYHSSPASAAVVAQRAHSLPLPPFLSLSSVTRASLNCQNYAWCHLEHNGRPVWKC